MRDVVIEIEVYERHYSRPGIGMYERCNGIGCMRDVVMGIDVYERCCYYEVYERFC